MKRIVLYILLLFIISYGCSAKKSVVLDETKVLGGKVVVNKVEMKKDVNKYTFLIKANGLRDVNVYYGKNPFALTVVMPNSSLDTETMKFVYSDELVERVSLLPKQDQSIIYVQLKDDVDYSYDITPDGLRLSFKVDKAVVQNVLKSSNWLETVDILNIKTSTFVSDFENLSSNNELLVSIGSDGVAKIDYGYIDANSFYIDFFDVKLVGDKVVYSGLGIVKDVKVVTSLFPQKVRFILNLEKNVNVGLGFLNGKYIISSNPEKLKGTSLYINKIESRTVGKIQGINISSTGKLKYDKKIIDGNLVLIFEDNVRFARDVSPVMYFDGSPIKYVKVGKVQGKPAVVFVPDGDIFSKVEDEKGSIVVYSSKDKFAKPAEVDQKQVPKGKIEPSDLVSLSIKDMDIKEAIKLIYYGRGKNIIFGKEVQGKTTIFVKDVHYKTALAAIYRENNLVEIEEDNVIWVISKQRQDEMMAEKAKLQKIVEEEKKTEPLFTEIIPVNYYKASDFDAVVKGVLSPRGKVQVEGKSNSFVVTDTKDAIAKVKSVLKEVDKPTPQVTIEARIVEV
ncbi:MAG: hypothetical protein N3C60_05610, partial [Calditerrivibrio sp.]|nr:hypothetical protein [Calditerrivibrio sp.]